MKNPIRELRELLKVSQAEFARLIGRSSQSVRVYEKHPEDTPREVIDRVRTIATEAGHADWAVFLLSDEWRVVNVLYPGETLISRPTKPIPAKEGLKLSFDAGNIPVEAVLSLLRSHWNDSRYRQCILDIGLIFDAGDDAIIDAIARNGQQFARLAEAVRRNREHGPGTSATTRRASNFEGRVAGLLEDEAEIERTSRDPKAPAEDPRSGRPGVEPMERRHIRKIGGRRRD